MRKNKTAKRLEQFSILTLDDDTMMTLTLKSYFESSGYSVDTENDPLNAIERIRGGHYDILLLDFLMTPICGDEVVARIREFNAQIFIILLTGHKSLAPPIKTIRELDIQGYYEKSDRFDQLELLVESCVKCIRQMRAVKQYKDGLAKIVEANIDIFKIQPQDDILKAIIQHMSGLIGDFEGFIFAYGQNKSFLAATEKYASLETNGDEARFIGEGEPGRFLLHGEDGGEIGILYIEALSAKGNIAMQLAEIFSKQVAAAISNSMLTDVVNAKTRELERAYDMLNDNYLEMTKTVRSMVDARDIYTRGHSDRVSYYAGRIASAMGKDRQFIERIRVSGLFHDIGKIGIPDSVLLKNSKLTTEEYEQIKKHPGRGGQMLAAANIFKSISPIVASHHERIDGGGYPQGLSGSDIPEESRIISIADAFDAMTSHRRYRENLSLRQAISQLEEGRGSQFDADMVRVFVDDILKDYETIKDALAWTYSETADEHGEEE